MRTSAVAVFAIVASILAAPALAQTKVSLGTARDPNLGAQIVIAREEGYFKQAGLDVDIKNFPSGGDLMSAFVGGSIAYGSAGATPMLTILSRPFPLKVIAQISDISGAQQIIAKKSVNSLADLRGKKVGLLRGTASEALWNSAVKAYNFDPASVQLVNEGPAEMITTFVRGDVDAVVLWEPHTTKARTLGDGKTLVSGTYNYQNGKAVPQRIYGDHAVLIATEDTVKQQPAVTKSLLGALEKANDFIATHRAQAVAVLAKEYELEPSQMDAILNVNHYTLRLDNELVGDIDKLADFLYSIKRIPNPVHIRDAIDPAPLRSVKADLVQLK